MATNLPGRTTRPSGSVLSNLLNQWEADAASTRGNRELRRWKSADDRLAGFRSLHELLDALRGSDFDRSRELWWALLAQIETADDLASRTLLQSVAPGITTELGGLRRQTYSKQWSDADTSADELDQIVLTSAIQAVHEMAGRNPKWPVLDHRRRTRRLSLQALKRQRVWGERTCALSHDDPEVELAMAAESSDLDVAAELLAALGEVVTSGRITADAASLVWRTRCGGFSPDQLADESNVSPDTLRRRRHRVEAVLVGALQEAA